MKWIDFFYKNGRVMTDNRRDDYMDLKDWIIAALAASTPLTALLGVWGSKKWETYKRNKRWKEALLDMEAAVEGGQNGRLFIFSTLEHVAGMAQPRQRLEALFANRHNLELIQRRIQAKRLVSFTLEEHEPGNPIHNAAIMVSIANEARMLIRDERRRAQGKTAQRNRAPLEPDNVTGGLQAALGEQAVRQEMAAHLMQRYSMVFDAAQHGARPVVVEAIELPPDNDAEPPPVAHQ